MCPVCNKRSIWDIVWSCLATIFACSWVAVHPNVPGTNAGRKRSALTRLELMVWTVIAPEVMILWAMRQWIGARRLEKTYEARGWTQTHGHFLQMGGFMLYRGSTRLGVLSPAQLKQLSFKKQIQFPPVTEEEIKDRSKGDALSKTLALGQTLWFVAQCITRPAQGLITTELELITLAFAALNGFMYYFWWNKPLDVKIPMPVYLLNPDDFSVDAPTTNDQNPHQSSVSMSFGRSTKQFFLNWIVNPLVSIFARLGDMSDATRSSRSNFISSGALKVPTFYPCKMTHRKTADIIIAASFIGMLFGAIHVAGWNFSFPSHIEKLIWRTSSLVILGVPFPMVILQILTSRTWGPDPPADFIGVFLAYVGIPLYIIARFAILVEAFLALRHLTPGALIQVEWAAFLPHI